jgi:hypothetical protein
MPRPAIKNNAVVNRRKIPATAGCSAYSSVAYPFPTSTAVAIKKHDFINLVTAPILHSLRACLYTLVGGREITCDTHGEHPYLTAAEKPFTVTLTTPLRMNDAVYSVRILLQAHIPLTPDTMRWEAFNPTNNIRRAIAAMQQVLNSVPPELPSEFAGFDDFSQTNFKCNRVMELDIMQTARALQQKLKHDAWMRSAAIASLPREHIKRVTLTLHFAPSLSWLSLHGHKYPHLKNSTIAATAYIEISKAH